MTPSSRILSLCEMQTASSRIWTRVGMSMKAKNFYSSIFFFIYFFFNLKFPWKKVNLTKCYEDMVMRCKCIGKRNLRDRDEWRWQYRWIESNSVGQEPIIGNGFLKTLAVGSLFHISPVLGKNCVSRTCIKNGRYQERLSESYFD